MPKRLLALALLASCASGQTRILSRTELRDRIAGGWTGQTIGAAFGGPAEFQTPGKAFEGRLPAWKAADGLRLQSVYLDTMLALVLDGEGIGATLDHFAPTFRDSRHPLSHANLAVRRNLQRGIPADRAGSLEFNPHAHDLDFQAQADFIGLMAPGLPRGARDLAYHIGRVMSAGEGIEGGVFVACLYSAAFFERQARRVVDSGMRCLPAASSYRRATADVLALHARYPKDWKAAWRQINRRWDNRDTCPVGALTAFNSDAKLNGAYIALAILYGGGELGRTMEIATRAGQASGANSATAAGVVGVMLGYKRLPDAWRKATDGIGSSEFLHTDFTLPTIVESTEFRALALIRRNGGSHTLDRIRIRTQRPVARVVKGVNPGTPVERISVSDARWKWTGEWSSARKVRSASERGAEGALTFAGTGAIVSGVYSRRGGLADVYLDGKLHRTVDSYLDEDARSGEALWHVFGLANGNHTVRIVVRGEPYILGEPYKGSTGTEIAIEDLIVLR